MPAFVRVAVPVPRLDALTYRVPPPLEPVRGARVLVPVGSRLLTGCVLGPADAPDVSPEAIRDIVEVLDDEPFLPAEILDLASWVADYYLAGIGEAMASAVPPFAWLESRARLFVDEEAVAGKPPTADPLIAYTLRYVRSRRGVSRDALVDAIARAAGDPEEDSARREARRIIRALEREGLLRKEQAVEGRKDAFRLRKVARLTASALDDDIDAALTPKQREALAVLREAGRELTVADLRDRGIGFGAVERLAQRGLVAIERVRLERLPQGWEIDATGSPAADAIAPDRFEGAAPSAAAIPIEPTPEQREAMATLGALLEAATFRVALLHGVTGSGKTEVYLRLAQQARAAGRSVLMLVPEIALTPAVAGRVRALFGDRVAIQHSGLSEGERHDQWHRIRRGEVDVVVGTRSAVFAPLDRVGLIVVDEEHDGSYKQEESPRYNGRDVAIVRGQRAGALVVLGSATPSLESYHNALSGRYTRVTLSRRVLDRPLPEVRIVNMRDEYAATGQESVISAALRAALADRLERREQAVVLLNRRGFASAVFCRQCGDTLECPNCSVALTVHRSAQRARCHYCNYTMRVPKACRRCAAPYLEYLGFGTERVESDILDALPGARVARVDRDTIRQRGAIARVLTAFGRHEIDVLVGTQMIAKGHDFPNVTLVGVVSADVGLGLADFRAAERTFQLLTQVAGRAGRGGKAGEAIIQTLYPDHYSIQRAKTQDYAAFFEREVVYRRGMRYPPTVAMINVVVRAPSLQDGMRDAGDLARRTAPDGRFTVLGPAPAPLGRLRGQYRVQIFLKGNDRRAMREAIRRALAERVDLARRVAVDVDPVSVL